MTCEWCKTDLRGGRYSNRECCKLRFAANAPPFNQREMFKSIAAKQGRKAADKWADKVKAEILRIKAGNLT